MVKLNLDEHISFAAVRMAERNKLFRILKTAVVANTAQFSLVLDYLVKKWPGRQYNCLLN